MPKGVYRRDSRPLAERFWEKVEKGAPGECWKWNGSTTRFGYGQISSKYKKGPLHAHRISWELHNGVIPVGNFVCHTCDNPPCTNPDHLFVGTQTMNMADCAAKGRMRQRPRPGESNPAAKLTAEQVAEIRAATGLHRVIAARYGIHKSHVSNLKRGEAWAHTFEGNQDGHC